MCAGVVVGISPVAASSSAAAAAIVVTVVIATSGEGGASADRRQADERVVVALCRLAFVRFTYTFGYPTHFSANPTLYGCSSALVYPPLPLPPPPVSYLLYEIDRG